MKYYVSESYSKSVDDELLVKVEVTKSKPAEIKYIIFIEK